MDLILLEIKKNLEKQINKRLDLIEKKNNYILDKKIQNISVQNNLPPFLTLLNEQVVLFLLELYNNNPDISLITQQINNIQQQLNNYIELEQKNRQDIDYILTILEDCCQNNTAKIDYSKMDSSCLI